MYSENNDIPIELLTKLDKFSAQVYENYSYNNSQILRYSISYDTYVISNRSIYEQIIKGSDVSVSNLKVEITNFKCNKVRSN